MNAPYFSVVIPTYNRAGHIGRTIESVLAQTFADLEVLVVDDGSRDNTAEVVGDFTDPRLHYLPKENGERGAARNYGLARALGEYVLFLDSDDAWYPTRLAVLHAAIQAEAQPPNLLATKYDLERNGQLLVCNIDHIPAGRYGLDLMVDGNPVASNFCVRRLNPGLFPFEEDRRYAAVEDWMFILQNTQHDTLLLLDDVTLTMNDHDERSMRSDNQALINNLERAANWMQQHLTLTPSQRRRLLGRVYYTCAIHAHIDGHWGAAVRYTRRALAGLTGPEQLRLAARVLTPPPLLDLVRRLRTPSSAT